MKSSPLIQYGNLVLYHETAPANDVEELICSTYLGSPDGIRYQLLDSKKKIYEIKPLHFFPLRKNNQLLYVMALAERITFFNKSSYVTYYVRYVSFNENLSTSGKKATSNEAVRNRIGKSFIKEAMKKHAETFVSSFHHSVSDPDKKIYYAYVEEGNYRSMDFTTFFFHRIRSFSVISFSRFFPKMDKNVTLVANEETDQLFEMISNEYSKSSFFCLQKEDLYQNYYVLKENNKVIAGLRVGIANWKIKQMPAILMNTFLKLLPHIPVFRRLLRKDMFQFLTFDTLICQEGKEYMLPVLFESVCAAKKIHSAMIYLDKDTAYRNKIKNLKKMGLLNRLFSEAEGAVLARFVNFSESEIKKFHENPVFISGYDLC